MGRKEEVGRMWCCEQLGRDSGGWRIWRLLEGGRAGRDGLGLGEAHYPEMHNRINQTYPWGRYGLGGGWVMRVRLGRVTE